VIARFEKKSTFRRLIGTVLSLGWILFAAKTPTAQVVQDEGGVLSQINVEERVGETVPLDTRLVDAKGRSVLLGDYFAEGRPVILILGYYTCPMLCDLVFGGAADGIRELSWLPGREFQMVTVSIDPRDTDLIAAAKQKSYLERIGKPGIDKGWAFLTGSEAQSHALAEAVGFQFFFDDETDQYAHAAVMLILTDEGKIARYLYGIEFKERDLRLALVEASEGKVGSTLDRIILYCYHYDPQAGTYVIFAGNLMRLGGGVTLVVLAVLLGFLWLRERRRRSRSAAAEEGRL
jgi:protein SCO1/2